MAEVAKLETPQGAHVQTPREKLFADARKEARLHRRPQILIFPTEIRVVYEDSEGEGVAINAGTLT